MTETLTNAKDTRLRGIVMVSITTLLWGVLPILQKIALNVASPGTVVWFRFLFAFAILYPLLHFKESKPFSILRRPPMLGIIAGVCLAGNYFGVITGIQWSGPSNAAVLVQLAPVLLVISGWLLFKETLSRQQIVGFVIAVAGFVTFYRDQLNWVSDVGNYRTANAFIIFGAVIWVAFMICQKRLSKEYGAQSLNLLIYCTAALALTPLVDWQEFAGLSPGYWMLIVFLGLNTLIAYGALAEAVRCVPFYLISVITALNPLITVTVMEVLSRLNYRGIDPEPMGWTGWLGALIAISGVVLVVRKV